MDKEAWKRIYLERCLELFSTNGLKMSTDTISKELGISKRTLYELFGSKDLLVNACMDYATVKLEKLMVGYKSKVEQDVIETLFIMSYLHTNKEAVTFRKMMGELKSLYPALYMYYFEVGVTKTKEFMAECVIEGKKQKIFHNYIHPELVSQLIFGIQTTLHSLLLTGKYTVDEIIRNGILCFLRGMSTSLGLEQIDKNFAKHGEKLTKTILEKIEDCLKN